MHDMCCRSPEWNKIAKSDRDRIGLTFDDDGEFWFVFCSILILHSFFYKCCIDCKLKIAFIISFSLEFLLSSSSFHLSFSF